MIRSYGSIFVFLGFVCGIAQIHADEMSVKVVEAPAETPGMRALFNGKDLAGWTGDARLWSVRDGVLRGETTEDESTSGNTFLIFKGDDRVIGKDDVKNKSCVEEPAVRILQDKWCASFACVLCMWFCNCTSRW